MGAEEVEAVVPVWSLGDRLRKARESRGLLQEQMALRLEVGRSTVSNWEKGTNRPTAATLDVWARVTNVPLWWLRGDDPNHPGAKTLVEALGQGEQASSCNPRHLKIIKIRPITSRPAAA